MIFCVLYCYSIEIFGLIPVIYVKYGKYSGKHVKSFNLSCFPEDLPYFTEFAHITGIGPNISILYNYVFLFKMFHIKSQNPTHCFTDNFPDVFRNVLCFWHIRCLHMFE